MKRYLIYICISLGSCLPDVRNRTNTWPPHRRTLRRFGKYWMRITASSNTRDIDWNEVHDRYKTQISDTMNQYVLFDVLGDMLNELKDGHTNLISTFNYVPLLGLVPRLSG